MKSALGNGIREMVADIKNIWPAIAVLTCFWGIMYFFYASLCPFRVLTGFPCPACGLTRAGLLLLTFHFKYAWEMNPSIYLWFPLILYALFAKYFWKAGLKYLLGILVIVSIITVIIFTYRMITSYPSTEPMLYHKNNIIFQLYKSFLFF